MDKATLCAATAAHVVALAVTMRASDVAEVEASSGRSPLEALRYSLSRSSHSAAALTPDGRVICIYGIGSFGFLSDGGSPWMLASDLLWDYRREFLRQSRKHLGTVLYIYPWLANMIDARQIASIRWLEWLGFKVGEPVSYGPSGALFRPFEVRRADV